MLVTIFFKLFISISININTNTKKNYDTLQIHYNTLYYSRVAKVQ